MEPPAGQDTTAPADAPIVYPHPVTIPPSAQDVNGHASNIEFVRWMQDAAVAHADAVGCAAATFAMGATWVIRSHKIEYRKPAYVGETIAVRTWIADVRRVASLRRYEFVRGDDVLAVGETEWVFVDASTGRPRRIPDDFKRLFGLPT
jgi:acyl-CoA thioester hydrolase